MSDLSEKLAFKRELPRHLRELGLLMGRPVQKNELLSLEETKAVRLRANKVIRQPVRKFEITFDSKREHRFSKFMNQLADANPSDVYLWTPASNMCGVLRPVPIKSFRITFPFDLNPEGIFTILTSDLHDQLLFDYSEGDSGEQLLEVESSGELWGNIAY
jgi:hypothetical protein